MCFLAVPLWRCTTRWMLHIFPTTYSTYAAFVNSRLIKILPLRRDDANSCNSIFFNDWFWICNAHVTRRFAINWRNFEKFNIKTSSIGSFGTVNSEKDFLLFFGYKQEMSHENRGLKNWARAALIQGAPSLALDIFNLLNCKVYATGLDILIKVSSNKINYPPLHLAIIIGN